jgi:hypothetical protein
MDQAMALELEEEMPEIAAKSAPRGRMWGAVVVAIVTTGLIVEAILTILRGRANGDMMIMVCPALGAIFLSIPAMRAWWVVAGELRQRERTKQLIRRIVHRGRQDLRDLRFQSETSNAHDGLRGVDEPVGHLPINRATS